MIERRSSALRPNGKRCKFFLQEPHGTALGTGNCPRKAYNDATCSDPHPPIADAQAQPEAVRELRRVPAGPISSDFVVVIMVSEFRLCSRPER